MPLIFIVCVFGGCINKNAKGTEDSVTEPVATIVNLSPFGLTMDAKRDLYVADMNASLIRKITPSGLVTILKDSTSTKAGWDYRPRGIAVDVEGNVFGADETNNIIKRITPSGLVTTLAGSGKEGSADGKGLLASFNSPRGIAVDEKGNIYVADSGNNLVRKITPSGLVTTFAGSGKQGSSNGQGILASFNSPSGIAVDEKGNIYVADSGNNLVRKITPSGLVTTLAGSGKEGSANGQDVLASFNFPIPIAVDAAGNVFVADELNQLIRKITPSGLVTTLAGSGKEGSANGQGILASFNLPEGIAVDAAGNVFVADELNHLIRKITPSGLVKTFVRSIIEDQVHKANPSNTNQPCVGGYGNESCKYAVKARFNNMNIFSMTMQYLGNGTFRVVFSDLDTGTTNLADITTDCNCNILNVSVRTL